VAQNCAAVLQNGYCSFWFVLELMGLMGNNVEDADAEYGDYEECELVEAGVRPTSQDLE